MDKAFYEVYGVSQDRNVDMRTTAELLAVERVQKLLN